MEDISPAPSLRIYFLLKWIAVLVILLFGLSKFLLSLAAGGVRIQPGYFATFLAFYLAVGWAACSLVYNKHHYWVTNKRIVAKRGLFGYSITSIPFDLRTDVVMTQNFFERTLGIANLKVETMPGAIGGEGLLRAVPKANEARARIMAAIKSNTRPAGQYQYQEEGERP